MLSPANSTRHAILADPTRRALLAALNAAAAPLGVRDLAAELGLHTNSVREQLRRLEQAGLVRVSRAAPAGRGRPGLRYLRVPEPEDPYRALATALADQVAALPDPQRVAEAAGERWGRDLAAGRAPGSGSDPAAELGIVLDLLDDAGFDPDPVAPVDFEIRIRACPFLPFDRRHLTVVCGVHLGFIRGSLHELGSSRDAVSIEPFVGPDLCVARLSRLPRA